ncbi:MAG: Glycosyltransferase, partial [uncultured Acetobacteraceae bacterium]
AAAPRRRAGAHAAARTGADGRSRRPALADRLRRLGAAGERGGPHAVHRVWPAARRRRHGGGGRPGPLPHGAGAVLPGDQAGGPAARGAGAHGGLLRAHGRPRRHRRAARLGHARGVPGAGLALHHLVPHQVPGIPARPHRHTAAARLGGAAPLPRERRRHLRRHALLAGGAGAARLHQGPPLDPRRGPRPVPAGAARSVGRAGAPGVPLRRAGGGGEEHRGLPPPRPARLQGGGGRRPAAAGLAGALSRGALRRLAGRRVARRRLRRRGRLRVPVAHRHLWAGDPGGHGLRRAGRGPSRDRTPRRHRRQRGRGAGRGPWPGGEGGVGLRPGALPRPRRNLLLGCLHGNLPPATRAYPRL